MSDEVSPGGSRIFRHESAPGETRISGGDAQLIEAIAAHLDHCFPAAEPWVFHEIVSPTVHLDVHVVPPSDGWPIHRLVTSGMAEAPMTVPEGFDPTPFAELTIALPPDWPMDKGEFADERAYWPFRLLKDLGRLPHEHATYLGHGHTIPNDDPPRPYAEDTELCCALIVPPMLIPEGFDTVTVADDRTVRLLGILPLYEDEMRLKLEKGTDALYELLDEHELMDLVEPGRPSVVPKRRRRLFGRS